MVQFVGWFSHIRIHDYVYKYIIIYPVVYDCSLRSLGCTNELEWFFHRGRLSLQVGSDSIRSHCPNGTSFVLSYIYPVSEFSFSL